MADDSVLRVRLDVDESDVSKLRVGERAYVTAQAYGTHKFGRRVIRVGGILGKKNVRTDEPSKHVDSKILETLMELDPGQRLPLGLRVDAYVGKQAERNVEVIRRKLSEVNRMRRTKREENMPIYGHTYCDHI
jgi:hypothetical protein